MKKLVNNISARVLMALMALVLTIIFFNVNTTKAADDVLYITPSATDVIVGKEFTVKLSISHASGISAAMFNLNYDASMLTYVSGADGSSYAGVIPLNYMEATDSNKIEWTIKFKAVKTGTCKFSVSNGEFYSADEEEMKITYNTASVKLWAQGSDDATLKSIEIGGHSLSPAFAKWTINYTVKVPTTTTSVTVSAKSTQGGRVEVKGNYTNLAFGNNIVTITSYAPNGKAMKYTITIVRPEPVTEPPTVPTTEPPAWSEVIIDGISYNINSDYTKNIIPDGFEPTVYDYKGNGVLASFGSKTGLNLLYLVDSEKKGKFFIYDGQEDKFYPFIILSSASNQYIVLPESMQTEPPYGCSEGVIEIGDYDIDGYINDKDSDFSYFFAVNQNGEKSWYCYDISEGTIQRMYDLEAEKETIIPGPSEEEITSIDDGDNDFSSENEELKAQNRILIKIRNIAIPVAAVLAVVLLGLIIFLLSNKNEKKDALPDENVNYAKLEKEEDLDVTEEVDLDAYEAAILSQMAAAEEAEAAEAEAEEEAKEQAEAEIFRAEAEAIVAENSMEEEIQDIPDDRDDVEKEIISLDDEDEFL